MVPVDATSFATMGDILAIALALAKDEDKGLSTWEKAQYLASTPRISDTDVPEQYAQLREAFMVVYRTTLKAAFTEVIGSLPPDDMNPEEIFCATAIAVAVRDGTPIVPRYFQMVGGRMPASLATYIGKLATERLE